MILAKVETKIELSQGTVPQEVQKLATPQTDITNRNLVLFVLSTKKVKSFIPQVSDYLLVTEKFMCSSPFFTDWRTLTIRRPFCFPLPGINFWQNSWKLVVC